MTHIPGMTQKFLPVIVALTLSGSITNPAAAGGHHSKGQLIAVPMQGQAVANSQMSFVQPQMSFVQPQMSFVQPQMSFVQPQMSFVQPQTMASSFSTAPPNVTINVSPSPSQASPAPAAAVPSAPAPNVTINVIEAQPKVASAVPSSPQAQMSVTPPQSGVATQSAFVNSALPANAIPVQLYLAPKSHRSHHLFEKHHSIFVLKP